MKMSALQIVSTVNFPKPIYLASHFVFTLKIIYKQSTLVDTVYIICWPVVSTTSWEGRLETGEEGGGKQSHAPMFHSKFHFPFLYLFLFYLKSRF